MRSPRRTVPSLLAALVLGACTLPPLATPTPTPSPSPTPVQAPEATAEPSAAVESAAPELGATPSFSGGEIVTTTVPGLRVRDLPGLNRRVIADLLPAPHDLSVLMGPIVADEIGWYLVTDADPAAPEFEEGWVAAGFEPEANLRSTGRVDEDSPVIVALAHNGDAEFGPIEIPDEHHIIRWVAVDPEAEACRFAVSLAAGAGEAVPAIRATLGAGLTPGVLQTTFFIGQPALRGQIFLSAESDCAWALAVIREVRETPSPPA